MRTSTLVGIKVGLILLLAFIALMGQTNNAPYSEWLNDAFMGVAFTFAWGLGIPEMLAYVLSVLVFAAIFGCGFVIGQKFSRKLDH
ncbi:hypothetical protein A1OS_07160 [Enterovibrio norvegicus]|uniref:hypothetical protein n=1 Tax=Enterovibrio norvegicus TaxID=188144 RepID=UPI0002EE4D06|nr:hypothetical protein [Enterovibrio norvegicus]OEE49545.1 hypothetical protein A1OS_07160 [Enterovibrio norvegicus]